MEGGGFDLQCGIAVQSVEKRDSGYRVNGESFDLVLANLPYVRRDAVPGLPIATSFEPALARGATRVERELYGAGPADLLARLHEIAPRVRSATVIGHNPGLEELALLLARDGARVRELRAKFPTGALATLEFRGPGWAALDRGTAELIAFVRPRDLESA